MRSAGSADHQVHEVAVLPGAAYCEMALAAARAVFGDAGEVRDVAFEQMLLLDETTPVSASASEISSGVVEFAVETYQAGERTRRASAVLHADAAHDEPTTYDIDALRSAHPHSTDGADLRAGFATVGIRHGAAFAGLAAAFTADESTSTVLATVALPGPLRSQQAGYGVHPALLDACFQSVVRSAPLLHPGSLGPRARQAPRLTRLPGRPYAGRTGARRSSCRHPHRLPRRPAPGPPPGPWAPWGLAGNRGAGQHQERCMPIEFDPGADPGAGTHAEEIPEPSLERPPGAVPGESRSPRGGGGARVRSPERRGAPARFPPAPPARAPESPSPGSTSPPWGASSPRASSGTC